jgi:hypothetical protein
MIPFISRIAIMFAHSNTDRLEMFKKLAKSLSEKEPEPLPREITRVFSSTYLQKHTKTKNS